eukprot:TRINITY_DN3089_c0_g1_i3.p1 TRINITY_DN3089_c0_g1~~TRINITY_DN3089_c0_g1_i3.p1  ORF type:complete len:868 (-),score=205.36 TRINITY_DN3089_c0_g1_i3:122-2566(-)
MVAKHELRAKFGSSSKSTTDYLLLRCHDDNGTISRLFVNETTITLLQFIQDGGYNETVGAVEGYYTMMAEGQGLLAPIFISRNGHSSIVSINLRFNAKPSLTDFLRDLHKQSKKWDTWNDTYDIEVFGYDITVLDVSDFCIRDLERIEYIALPLALLVLMFMLRSITLVLLPIINVLACSAVTCAVMYPVSSYVIQISVFGPPIMLSLIIAMSIDYSLFVLMRFKEEACNGGSNTDAVNRSMLHAGRIVLTSGGVLLATYIGLVVFPLEFIRAIGVSAAAGLFFTIVVSLSLTPALLLILPCFRVPGIIPCIKKCREEKPINVDDLTKSLFFRSTHYLTSTWWAVGICVAGIVVMFPFIFAIKDFYITMDDSQLYPMGSDSVKAFDDLKEDWPAGLLMPYNVLCVADTGIVSSNDFFNHTNALAREIDAIDGISANHILSVTFLAGVEMHWDNGNGLELNARTLLNGSTPLGRSQLGAAYRGLWDAYVNNDTTAAIMKVATDFDPAVNISDFVNTIRPLLERYSNDNYSYYLSSSFAEQADCVDLTLKYFPYVIGGTAIVVLVLLMVVFRSVFIAARVVVTLSLTLLWVFGFATAVFSAGWFNWASGKLDDVHGLYWLGPVLTFSIILGLGLDYDIFLFSRIVEFRQRGFSDRLAVRFGVERTGAIVTVAGLIMAIAFGGLMSGSTWLIIQMGFLEAFAVVVDTFVVRTVLTPCIVYLAGRANWWPRKLPVAVSELRGAHAARLLVNDGDDGDEDRDGACAALYADHDTPFHDFDPSDGDDTSVLRHAAEDTDVMGTSTGGHGYAPDGLLDISG